ncbi:MAG TPA: YMGG-like glycine zipper-containing protein [Thermoanaerobaculia bacterium]|nr:YMGG-like glycine zipper-containing protein [Thermoanaerobaculia bacterium]
MFNNAKRHIFIALLLIGLMSFGAVAAEARDRDTNGSDRLLKGAAVGAAVGAVTQAVRGRTEGRELLKGAAVGGAVGAAVGAYSDYKQEKNAREDERHDRRGRYYEGRSYRGSRRGDYYPRDNRARRGHRHTAHCSHRR